MAVKLVIEPIFEHQFLPVSRGFRPGRGCKDALREVNGWLQAGDTHVVDADLKGYFDSIPHERLLDQIKERIRDGRLLALLEAWLKQEVMQEMKCWTPTGGTPQGAVISPLLANIYLHGLDAWMTQRGYRMARYADDFVIVCPSADEAQRALVEVQAWVKANGLTLHPDKTRVGDCLQPGQGFEFLGYRFEAGRRWVRKKSWKALKSKVREKTLRTRGGFDGDHCGRPEPHAAWVVWLLQACPSPYLPIAEWPHSPSAACTVAQAGKASRLRPVLRRPPTLAQCLLRSDRAVHHGNSLVSGEPIPMRKPSAGEPCAGEPHAPFGGWGGFSPSRPLSGSAGGFQRWVRTMRCVSGSPGTERA